MIRHFVRTDIRRLKSNDYSNTRDIGFVFDDPDFYKFALVYNDEDVHAIICFKRYWKNNFVAFFLISEDILSVLARELKEFILEAREVFQADRIQTESVANKTLDRWHEFLGFTLEGCRPQMIFDKDYNQWGMLKGRDF